MFLAAAPLLFVLAVPPSPGVTPAGDEAAPAVTETPAEPETAAEAWEQLDECRARAAASAPRDPDAAWEHALACGRLVRAVARLDDAHGHARLWSLYDGAAGDSFFQERLLDALLDWHVARKLEEHARGEQPRAPPAARDGALMPAALAEAGVELQDAWRLYDALVHLASGAFEGVPAERRLSFHEHAADFRRTLSDWLRGRAPAGAAADALGRYEWGGMCGNGSGWFYGSQMRALLAARWQGGEPAPVTQAAALSLLDLDTGEFLPDWRQRVLAAAGIDWEQFFVGGVLAGHTQLAAPLAERGSENAARLLIEAADLPHPYIDEHHLGDASDVLAALSAFVATEGPCAGYDTSHSGDVARAPDAPAVAPHVEARVLELLAQKVEPTAGRAAAEGAAHALLRLCRPESRGAFAQMRRSPFYELRERGTLGLRALGETVPDARRGAPVAFRVTVDGRPLAAASLQLTLTSAGESRRYQTVTADAHGTVHVERDEFLDPRAPVTSVILSADQPGPPEALRFSAPVAPPRDLDTPTAVKVETGILTVTVPPGALERGDGAGEAYFMLRRTDDAEDDLAPTWSVTLPAGPVTFARLQRGTYAAQLYFTDGTQFESPEVTVSDQPATMELHEAPPRDAYAAFDAAEP